MGYEQQKLDEKLWFTRFMSLAGQFEEAQQFDQPSEPAPDIVVPRLSLGVEITEAFHDDGDVRRREGEERSTLALAQRLYYEAGHPPVDVSLHWSEHHSPLAKERERLAQAIIRCVLDNLPADGLCERIDLRDQDELPVVSLSLHRLPASHEPYWRASRGAFPPHCDPAVLQERIGRKNGKVREYREYCHELWLLVVASHADTASWCTNAKAIVDTHVFDSAFDRTFFMIWPAEYYELRTLGS